MECDEKRIPAILNDASLATLNIPRLEEKFRVGKTAYAAGRALTPHQ